MYPPLGLQAKTSAIGESCMLPVIFSSSKEGQAPMSQGASRTAVFQGKVSPPLPAWGSLWRKRCGRLCWRQGFYVLIDYHAAPGDTTVSSGNFQSDWTALWSAVVGLPDFADRLAGRLFLDLINEPDGIGIAYVPHSGFTKFVAGLGSISGF